MDEQGSTNEDLDLCSELDTVSDFGQEDVADGTPFKHTLKLCDTNTTELIPGHRRSNPCL